MNLGVIFMLLTALIQSFIAVAVKQTSSSVSISTQVLYYYFVPLIIFIPLLLKQGSNLIKTERLLIHFVRGFFATLSVFCFFYAIKHVPLGISATLFNTIPIFVPLIAGITLKEKIFFKLYVGIFLALAGVLVIIDPRVSLFSPHDILIGLCSAFLMAVSAVLLRYLAKEKEPISQIVFYQYLSCSMISLIILFIENLFSSNSIGQVVNFSINFSSITLLLIILGILSISAQFTFSKASQYLPAGQSAPFFYASVPISSLLGWVIWNQKLTFSMAIGSLLVFIGICVCAFGKQKNKRISFCKSNAVIRIYNLSE